MTVVALSQQYVDAVAYALDVHVAQRRRGTDVPYAAHLLGVSSLVLEAGGDEELAIAALLHDAAEDHGGEARLADIERRFGARVAGIVRECSDSLTPEEAEKGSWEERKREHLARLAHASPDTLTVWAADKVHNARAIVVDLELNGQGALAKFHAPADRIAWYYAANRDLLEQAGVVEELLVPLRDVVTRLVELMGR